MKSVEDEPHDYEAEFLGILILVPSWALKVSFVMDGHLYLNAHQAIYRGIEWCVSDALENAKEVEIDILRLQKYLHATDQERFLDVFGGIKYLGELVQMVKGPLRLADLVLCVRKIDQAHREREGGQSSPSDFI